MRGHGVAQIVDRGKRRIDRGVETERIIRIFQIVIDRFRKSDNIKSFLAEHVGGLMGSVSAQDYQVTVTLSDRQVSEALAWA